MAEAPSKASAAPLPALSVPQYSAPTAPGTRDSPIALFDDEGNHNMKDEGGEPAPRRIKLEQQPVPTAKSVSSFSTMTIGTSDAGSKAAFGTDGDSEQAQDLKGGVGKGMGNILGS